MTPKEESDLRQGTLWLYRIGYRLRARRETAGLILINECWIRLYKSGRLSAAQFIAFDAGLQAEFPVTAQETRLAISDAMVGVSDAS